MAFWTAKVTASGEYALEFKKYSPGVAGSATVVEDALIETNRLYERKFTLVLNNDFHSADF